jgi:hypothetical protein
MKIALVKDGIVVNTIIAESVEFAQGLFPKFQCVDITEINVTIGAAYSEGVFINPPRPELEDV